MKKILLVNPNTSADTTEMMLAVARPLLPPGLALHGVSATRGDAMILDEAALAAAEQEVVRIGLTEAHGFDAIVVAAFGDPGALRLRARLTIPVIGIGESALRAAAAGPRRFGVATTTPHLLRAIEAGIHNIGIDSGCTGVRVTDGDPLALAGDPARQDQALTAAATLCIEQDGAEAVVIGGGPLSGSAARLRSRFREAIIEPVPAAMRCVLQCLAT